MCYTRGISFCFTAKKFVKGSGAMKTKEEIIKNFLDENGEVFAKITNDYLFKEVFGTSTNKKYLADFLESLLGYKRGYLQGKLKCGYEVSLEKREYLGKSSRCDLIVSFNNVILDLEMYHMFNREALEKSDFYVVTIKSNQVLRGMNYNQNTRIMQFNIIENDNYGLKEEDYNQRINNIQVSYIIIDKTLNSLYDKDSLFGKYLRLFIAEIL